MEILKPKLVERPWGGSRLASWCGGDTDTTGETEKRGAIGEAWVHEGNEPPRVLLKWIDAREILSVQNHPSDPGYSKNEAWYFLEAPREGRIVTGIKGGIDDEAVPERLLWTDVKKGDFLFVPAGCVHALTPGSFVLEIQQPLNVTYRIYDWGRGRPLQIEEAARAFRAGPPSLRRCPLEPGRHILTDRREFRVECVNGPVVLSWRRPYLAAVVKGPKEGVTLLCESDEEMEVRKGERVILVTDGEDE
ncbi:MAG: hypothetical protein D6679_13040 [Candidatus Hydrogenedentota bacterium]|nr:MAG: hypothetical protein D6679_13040 [Candidatus Hydrogenedentota bacterium]